nr:cell division ATP-binding protein FtsE [Acetivibrio ethanolgignens]
MEENPIITLEHVSKTYPAGTKALQDLSLTIHKGEFVFIVGSSGSGKSTLIKLLLKEIEPTSGKIEVNGQELTTMKHKQVAKYRRKLGVVFQDFRLLKDRNVFENVAFALRVVGKSNYAIRRQVPAILTIMGLGDKYASLPRQLSGGEQQRVALARALVNKPPILLADEPTGNLDPKNSWEIMKLLDEINKKGTTVVVVTHNSEIVDAMQKRVITMKKGVMISDEQKGGYSYDKH